MNVSDWQHKENQQRANELRAKGYQLEVSSDGYAIRAHDHFVGGASVMLPREKPIHWKHRVANQRDNLQVAVLVAAKHEQEQH